MPTKKRQSNTGTLLRVAVIVLFVMGFNMVAFHKRPVLEVSTAAFELMGIVMMVFAVKKGRANKKS